MTKTKAAVLAEAIYNEVDRTILRIENANEPQGKDIPLVELCKFIIGITESGYHVTRHINQIDIRYINLLRGGLANKNVREAFMRIIDTALAMTIETDADMRAVAKAYSRGHGLNWWKRYKLYRLLYTNHDLLLARVLATLHFKLDGN